MTELKTPAVAPDLTNGIPEASLVEGVPLLGNVIGEPVLLARRGDEVFCIGNVCTHYGASLNEGLLVGDTVRCPWHHACFSLRSGEALRAPALDPVSCWRIERRDGKLFVRERLREAPPRETQTVSRTLATVAIVGGGAAGAAAALILRREGYDGSIVMLSADGAQPCDRPSLSKGYLAGTAPEEGLPLRAADFYDRDRIALKLGTSVTSIDVAARQLHLADGSRQPYDALLLAPGAEPVRLAVPGADLPHVYTLRTEADSRAIVAAASTAHRVAVIGASFIGLEVASSLRNRKLDVDVIAPETCLMEKILGPRVGQLIRRVHEDHGVRFHLGTTVTGIDAKGVNLANGERLAADLVVAGIGVRPNLALATQAGLAIDRGVVVDEYLQTSAAGIFAAGDIARWPDRLTGERIRVEHWVVAERQGQTAARNILGRREPFAAVPFFWTEQFDLSIAYTGHAEGWDEARIDGDMEARDCRIAYCRGGQELAVATIGRDVDGLRAELEFERRMKDAG